MITRTSRLLAVSALAALVAGCGGGAVTSSIPTIAPVSQSGNALVTLSVVVPSATTLASQRAPQYISPSTKSVVFTVSPGGATTTISTPSSGTYTGTIAAPVGSDTFSVTANDASGKVLSQNTLAQTINAGQNNKIAITLNGVVASLSIVPASSVYEGTSGTATNAVVNGLDQDGNVIAGTFANGPITLTGSSTFTLSGSPKLSSGGNVSFSYAVPDPYDATKNISAADGSGKTLSVKRFVTTVADIAALSSGTSLQLWYDAQDVGTVQPGSTFTWVDRAQHANLTQSSAANQPANAGDYAQIPCKGANTGCAAAGGKPAVWFNALQFLSSQTGFPSGDYTIFVVGAFTQANNPSTIENVIGSSQNGHAIALIPDNPAAPVNYTICLYEGQPCPGPKSTSITESKMLITETSYQLMAMVAKNTGTLGFNGAIPTGAQNPLSGVSRTGADSTIVVNGYGSNGNNSGSNTIGEIVILNGGATPQQQQAFAAYFKAKWNVPPT